MEYFNVLSAKDVQELGAKHHAALAKAYQKDKPMTSLREKLERLRGNTSEWIGGFPPPRIDEDEWNALIDVALAASFIDTNGDDGSGVLGRALSRLDKVLE